ncbi:MAG: DUF362 domain-containing protein [Dysgonamonadaceae bacterium]|jgi:uncharacterized protein (DUF362 family)|nr:DUF362 domain-containing protein [Dysgonamonadaceae bacterium]
MKRRDFLRTSAALGVAALTFDKLQAAMETNTVMVEAVPDMVAVMGGEPAQLLDRALQEMGGIGKYVKKGQSVVIKPNIGWDKRPDFAANTNPELIKTLVEQCLKAGARKVTVFDHTCDNWQKCYENSGIKKAAEAAGATVVPANDEVYYKEVKLPQARILKSTKIHQALLEADVWFNVPVLKNHDGAQMSIAMKNYMGIVWDRPYFHANNLQQCIADLCTWTKKPALNIVDAYRCMRKNGPQGRSVSDTSVLKTLIISKDIVAADTAAIGLFNQVQPMDIKKVGHIANGEKLNLGTQSIDKLNVKRIKIN